MVEVIRIMSGYLSPGQAGQLLGLSPQRIKQLAASGRIAGVRTPLGLIVSEADVAALAAERAQRDGPESA